jgi:PAS domain-containing protein
MSHDNDRRAVDTTDFPQAKGRASDPEPERTEADQDFAEQVAWHKTDKRARHQAEEEVAEDEDSGALTVISAADITPKAVSWVWHHRLPLGTLSLAAGKGGAAKSLHAVWLAAQLTLGLLVGCWRSKTKNVLWVTIEASPEIEIVPRLIAAGADLSMVHFVTVEIDDDPANDHIRIFRPQYVERLRKLVEELDVGMIVLDPVLDVLDGRIKSNDQIAVRQAIGRINAFAEDMGILILGIAHFNKMTSVDDALERITGSAAFSQRIRAAIVFAYNDDDDCFVISQGKNNWGPLRQPNLSFIAAPCTVAGHISTVRLEWQDEEYEFSVSDLLGKKHKSGGTPELDRAVTFLEEILRAGPVLKQVVEAKANEEKITPSTLERAYRKLRVKTLNPPADKGSRRSRGRPPVLWELPVQGV